jgi:two-component system heavy metal sensor histidine kinase CusS
VRKSLRSRLALLFAAAVGASLLASGGATIGVLVLQARTDREMELARGLPADDDDELAIQKAAVAMAIVAPLAMGAAALFGLLLARRALRPMRQATDRARAARASELDLTCP